MQNIDKEIFKTLRNDIELYLTVDEYSKLYEVKRHEAEKELEIIEGMKVKAVGDYNARRFIINTFTKILTSIIFNVADKEGNSEAVKINDFIDYNNILNNSPYIIFEILLDIYDISEIIDKYNLSEKITSEQIIDIAKKEEMVIDKHFSNKINQITLVAKVIYSQGYGQDCIDTLQYHNINDVGFTRLDYIYITYKTEKIYLEFLSFPDNQTLINIQKKNTRNSKVPYNEENVSIITSKDNSARIAVAGFDSIPDGENFYNERIFNLKKILLKEQREKYKTINNLIEELLIINAKGRGNYLVTGPDMTVGKSTMLLSIVEKIPNAWAIGILDPQNEMQAQKKYKDKNIMTFVKNVKKTLYEQFQDMLKFSRDVILVSEITSHEEASGLIDVAISLNAGIGATMHVSSPYETVSKLRNYILRAGTYKDKDTAERDIAKAIDLIIHMRKLKDNEGRGRIVVDSIYEIISTEIEQIIEPKFYGSFKERLQNLIDMFQLYIQKKLTNQNYVIKPLIKYSEEKDDWIVVNLPSKQYIEKLSVYVNKEKINNLTNNFKDIIKKQKQG